MKDLTISSSFSRDKLPVKKFENYEETSFSNDFLILISVRFEIAYTPLEV